MPATTARARTSTRAIQGSTPTGSAVGPSWSPGSASASPSIRRRPPRRDPLHRALRTLRRRALQLSSIDALAPTAAAPFRSSDGTSTAREMARRIFRWLPQIGRAIPAAKLSPSYDTSTPPTVVSTRRRRSRALGRPTSRSPRLLAAQRRPSVSRAFAVVGDFGNRTSPTCADGLPGRMPSRGTLRHRWRRR